MELYSNTNRVFAIEFSTWVWQQVLACMRILHMIFQISDQNKVISGPHGPYSCLVDKLDGPANIKLSAGCGIMRISRHWPRHVTSRKCYQFLNMAELSFPRVRTMKYSMRSEEVSVSCLSGVTPPLIGFKGRNPASITFPPLCLSDCVVMSMADLCGWSLNWYWDLCWIAAASRHHSEEDIPRFSFQPIKK